MIGPAAAALADADRVRLADLVPVVRRAATLDARAVARVRRTGGRVAVLVRLPFGVLVSRTVEHDDEPDVGELDVTVAAADLVAWCDGDTGAVPASRDADWRGGLPPTVGWTRLDTVPDEVIRPLVRQGALTLKAAAEREGVPGAQPRREVADALLDAVVLDVHGASGNSVGGSGGGGTGGAPVTLRALSALTRMGFLPRGGVAHVDVAGSWVRVAAGYGTVYLERPGGLGLLAPNR